MRTGNNKQRSKLDVEASNIWGNISVNLLQKVSSCARKNGMRGKKMECALFTTFTVVSNFRDNLSLVVPRMWFGSKGNILTFVSDSSLVYT